MQVVGIWGSGLVSSKSSVNSVSSVSIVSTFWGDATFISDGILSFEDPFHLLMLYFPQASSVGQYVQSSNNKENDDDFWKLIQVVINFEVDCNASGRQSTEVGQ